MIEEVNKPSYYTILPAKIRYDKNLSPREILFYSEIVALSNKNKYCYASNKYFAELYEVDTTTVSKWVNHLADCGYLQLDYIKEGNEIKERHIRPLEGIDSSAIGIDPGAGGVLTTAQGGIDHSPGGIGENAKENNINNNITSMNTMKENNKKNSTKVLSESELASAIQNVDETNSQVVKYWIEHLPKSREFIETLLKWYSTQKKKPSIWQLQNKLDKLYKLYSTEKDQIECVLQSAVEGWIGFFEIRNRGTSQKTSNDPGRIRTIDINAQEEQLQKLQEKYGKR